MFEVSGSIKCSSLRCKKLSLPDYNPVASPRGLFKDKPVEIRGRSRLEAHGKRRSDASQMLITHALACAKIRDDDQSVFAHCSQTQ